MDSAPKDEGKVHRDLAVAAERAAGVSAPLKTIRTKVPWRESRGISQLIHPLRAEAFMTKYFGIQSVVLQRGSAHRAVLSAAATAGMLRGRTLGTNANMVPKTESAFMGKSAVTALSHGKPVNFNINHKVPWITKDPLFTALQRSSASNVSVDLFWAPTGVASLFPTEGLNDQIIQQVYGSRGWTVCARGILPSLEPVSLSRAQMFEERCSHTVLRRGDVLYLPSKSWYWTDASQGSSAHISVGSLPWTGINLVVSMGVQGRLSSDDFRLLNPLQVWQSSNIENSAPVVRTLCTQLPWTDSKDLALFCSLSALKRTLRTMVSRGQNAKLPPDLRKFGPGNFEVVPEGKSLQEAVMERAGISSDVNSRRNRKSKNRASKRSAFFKYGLWSLGVALLCILFIGGLICCMLPTEPQDGPSKVQYGSGPQARHVRRTKRLFASGKVE